jgi:hypothetical protein
MKSRSRVQELGGFLLAVLFLAAFGCAAPSPPQPPSLELPLPPSDLKAVRKGDRVALTWTLPTETTDGGGIRLQGPTRICRTQKDDQVECGVPIALVAAAELDVTQGKTGQGKTDQGKTGQEKSTATAARRTAHFTDTLPAERFAQPDATITYAVESLNADKHGAGVSNPATVSAARTEAPPADFRGELTSGGVILNWKGPLLSIAAGPHVPRYLYRVYRTEVGAASRTLVGEALMGTQAEMRLVDPGFTWEKTYDYRIEVVTHLDARLPAVCALNPASTECGKPLREAIDVEGEDSNSVRIVVHDVFPPAIPAALQAVFSGEGQKPFIDLTWTTNTETDLAGYNVYRREQDGQTKKINSEIVKAPSFRDSDVTAGKTYLYSVTAIDVRGNESAKSQETAEQVP